mgnify:CR=1 FL=1
MLAIVGDLHGDKQRLLQAVCAAYDEGASAVLGVGDNGWLPEWEEVTVKFPLPFFTVCGNHEHWQYLTPYMSDRHAVQLSKNYYYCPRGSSLNIDGLNVGFLGGATSVDSGIQKQYKVWSPHEVLTREQAKRLQPPVDVLITHCPPQGTIDRHLNPHNLSRFGQSIYWKDPCSEVVEFTWKRLGYPQLFCGHLHRPIHDGNRIRVLGEAECILYHRTGHEYPPSPFHLFGSPPSSV